MTDLPLRVSDEAQLSTGDDAPRPIFVALVTCGGCGFSSHLDTHTFDTNDRQGSLRRRFARIHDHFALDCPVRHTGQIHRTFATCSSCGESSVEMIRIARPDTIHDGEKRCFACGRANGWTKKAEAAGYRTMTRVEFNAARSGQAEVL